MIDKVKALIDIGFHVFPVVAGKKTPAITGFPHLAVNTHADAEKYWFDIVLGISRSDNIGISTSRFSLPDGTLTHLVAIDVDNKDGKNGSLELQKLEMLHGELPPTYVQKTPTGGLHYVFHTDKSLRQSASKIAHGLDVRAKGGYLVAAGSTVEAGVYTSNGLPVAQAPQWLVTLIENASPTEVRADIVSDCEVDQDFALKRAIEYLETAPIAEEGNGGDATTFAVCAKVKDFGLNPDFALDALLEHWNPRCEPPWDPEDLERKLQNAYRYGNTPAGIAAPEKQFTPIKFDPEELLEGPIQEHWLERINEEFALLFAGTDHSIVHKRIDKKGVARWEFLSERSFLRLFSNKKLDANARQTLATYWLDWPKRREYYGLGFWPSGDAPEGSLNLWTGFSKAPISPAHASREAIQGFTDWREHLLHGICDGNAEHAKWVEGWLAHMIQFPGEKPLTALVLRGAKGTGKNAFLDRLAPIIGQAHTLTVSNSRYLTSNFNSHMANCLMLVLDEAFWSGEKSADSILKGLTTDPHIVIERKGKEPYKTQNLLRLCIVGNEDWLVPASGDERRYAVFDVSDWKKQDNDYFRRMRINMDQNGGAEVLMDYLLSFDLSQVDVDRAPNTKALSDQKTRSFDLMDSWIYDSLYEGHFIGMPGEHVWPTQIPADAARIALTHYVRNRNVFRARIPAPEAIGLRLHKYGLHKRRLRREGVRTHIYTVPALEEARANFAQVNNLVDAWDEKDE